MDNFVILAKTKKELEKRTIKFLKMTKKYNLCFKQSKYDFDTKTPIIEVVSGQEKVQMEDKKTKTVKKWKNNLQDKRSKKLLGVCKFL